MVKKTKASAEEAIKVTVAQTGEQLITLVLEEGASVETALEKAGYSGHSARVNGEAVELEDTLEDGDELFVGKSVKGGM